MWKNIGRIILAIIIILIIGGIKNYNKEPEAEAEAEEIACEERNVNWNSIVVENQKLMNGMGIAVGVEDGIKGELYYEGIKIFVEVYTDVLNIEEYIVNTTDNALNKLLRIKTREDEIRSLITREQIRWGMCEWEVAEEYKMVELYKKIVFFKRRTAKEQNEWTVFDMKYGEVVCGVCPNMINMIELPPIAIYLILQETAPKY